MIDLYFTLAQDLELIAKAQDWKLMRSWFAVYENDDVKAIKCLLWGKFFLPTYFRDPYADFHVQLIKLFLSEKNEYIAAPRGFSKTSLMQLSIAFRVANQLSRFIVVVEKSFVEGSEVLRGIRSMFDDDAFVMSVYGLVVKASREGVIDERNKDTQGDVMINGVRLRAKGFNTPLRGLKAGEYRPDCVMIDDVEEDEHVRNSDQRRKYNENYTQGIVPALDIGGTIKVIGTILHNDSLLKNLIDAYGGVILRAFDPIDPQNTLLWPQRWTYARLMERKDQMESEGRGGSAFAQEYLNQPIDDENRKFHWDWLQKTFKPDDLRLKTVNRYVALDVADSKTDSSDWTAKITVDWDGDNFWYVQSAKRRKVNSPELIDWIFEIWINEKPVCIGVEKNAFADQVEPWLKIKSEQLDVYPVVVQLEHKGQRKEDRIAGALQGRFQAGKILFQAEPNDDTNLLKGELYDFPRSKHDDLVDSMAYIATIGSRPFSQKKDEKTVMQREIDDFFKSKRKSLARSI